MYRHEAFERAKRHNKQFKRAKKLIRSMSGQGRLVAVISSNLWQEAINMLRDDGYGVKKVGRDYVISWKTVMN